MASLKVHNYQRTTMLLIVAACALAGCSAEQTSTTEKTQTAPIDNAVPDKKIGTAGSFDDMRDQKALFADIENHVSKASHGKPTSNDYLAYAAELKNKRDFESSALAATQALKLAPNSGEAFLMRGTAMYYSTESLGGDEALHDVQMAAKLMPENGEAHRLLGSMYAAKKEFARAADEFSLAMKFKHVSGDRDLYRHRAAALHAIGRDEEALKDLDMFISLKPGSTMGYRLKAAALRGMHRDKDALECYDQAMRFSKDKDVDALLDLKKERGLLRSSFGRLKEAEEDFSSVIGTDPDDQDAFKMRGDVYCKMGKYDEAIRDYTTSIEKSPVGYRRGVFESRSRAYTKLGNIELANADKEKAKQEGNQPAEEKIYELK